jgi:hypothetical protein
MKKVLKNYWVCYGQNLYPNYTTISFTRKDSIKSFLRIAGEDWDWWKKKGYRCIKVNITFEEVVK